MDSRIEKIRQQLRAGRPVHIVNGKVVEQQTGAPVPLDRSDRPGQQQPTESPQGVTVKPHTWGH